MIITAAPAFRRTDADRRKPREVVTGRLLGDPPADLSQRRQEAAERSSMPLSRETRLSLEARAKRSERA